MKKNYIDGLIVLSCVGVVFLHTNGVFWTRPSGTLWLTSTFIETLFYFSVPIFFMISGATLWNYRDRYSTEIYFEKRIRRTLIPFIFWSIVAAILFYVSNKAVSPSLLQIPFEILNTKYLGIYWFFIPLFSCYIALPIFSKFKDQRTIRLLIIYTFLVMSVYPFLCKIINVRMNGSIQSVVTGGTFLFFMIGYYLSSQTITEREKRIIYILGILGFFVEFLGTYLLPPTAEGRVNGLFKGFLNYPSVLYASAVFLLFKEERILNLLVSKLSKNIIFSQIRKNSLPIYLFHGFVLKYIVPSLEWINIRSIWYRILAPIIIIFVCIVVSNFLRRVPLLRYTV